MFEAGQIIAKRYELQRLLGKGAMGSVFLAKDQRLAKKVAIKFINAEVLDDIAKSRFVEEGKSLALLNHKNIVRVFATGREGDSPYIVTEYIDGRSLREKIEQGGSLAWEDVFSFAEQLFRALAAGHKAKIVHRDVKPENIMVTDDGKLVLTDFGIARRDDRTRDLTGQGIIIGTPAYIAPEVWQGVKACPSSDVYSAALVVYEMAIGEYPHKAKNLTDYADFHLKKRKPKVSSKRKNCPPWFEELLATCLTVDKRKRSGNALEVATAIRQRKSTEAQQEAVTEESSPQGTYKHLLFAFLFIVAIAMFFLLGQGEETIKSVELHPKVGEAKLLFQSASVSTGNLLVFHKGKQIKLLPLSTKIGKNEIFVRGLKEASEYELMIKLPSEDKRLSFRTKEVKVNDVRVLYLKKRVSMEVDVTPREEMSLSLSFSKDDEKRVRLPKEAKRFTLVLDEASFKEEKPLKWQLFWKDKQLKSGVAINVEKPFKGPRQPRLPKQGISNKREPSGQPIWTKNGFVAWFRDGTVRSFSPAKTKTGLRQNWLYEHPGQGQGMRYQRGLAAVASEDGLIVAFGRPQNSMAICFLKHEERFRDWRLVRRINRRKVYWRPGRFRLQPPEWFIEWNEIESFKPRTNGLLFDSSIVFHGTIDNKAVGWFALDKEKRTVSWSTYCPQKMINEAPAYGGAWQGKKPAQYGWWLPYPPVLAKGYVLSVLAIGNPRVIPSYPFALAVLPFNSEGPGKPRILCRFFGNTNRCQVALDDEGYAYWTSANGLMRWKLGDFGKIELLNIKGPKGNHLPLTGPVFFHEGAIFCMASRGVGLINLRQTFHLLRVEKGKAQWLVPPLLNSHDDRGGRAITVTGKTISLATGRYLATLTPQANGSWRKSLWNPGMYTSTSFPWLVTLSVNESGWLNLGHFDGSVRLLPKDLLPQEEGDYNFAPLPEVKWKSLSIPK